MTDRFKGNEVLRKAFDIYKIEADALARRFEHAKEITSNPILDIGVPHILLVGNNNLRPDQLVLRGVDFQSIDTLPFPGRSVTVDSMGIGEKKTITKEQMDIISQIVFRKSSDRKDAVYTADVAELNEVGFRIYFCPLSSNRLHSRIVYEPYTKLEYPSYDFPQIPEESLAKLVSVLHKAKLVDGN